MRITKQLVQRSMSDDDPWYVGNQVLYDLCSQHPRHVNDRESVAKVWLIGRAYSASLERGRGRAIGPDVSNDLFYTEHVTQALRASEFDKKLKSLENTNDVDESSVNEVLDIHGYLVRMFEQLTSKGKRSLASKYLHFHRPNLFFIHDSRAASGIRKLAVTRESIRPPRSADPEYAKFVSAALGLRAYVSSEFGEILSPRHLDRLLLATFAAGDA